MKEYIARFERILNELDGLCGSCAGDDGEELEDLNAELEDTLMLLSELRSDEDGWREELSDILEQIRSLARDYREMGKRVSGTERCAKELDEVAELISRAV